MKMIFFALIVQCCINFASVQAFVITRASHGRDAFKIPTSICKPNGIQSGSDCKSFYALDGAHDCSCMCPAKNATFAYRGRRWSCVENRRLRRDLTQGCDFTTSFTVENADRRLPTLAFGARREISLWFIFWPVWTCTLNIRSSWYLGCRGSKIFLRRHYNAAVRLFTLSRRNSDAPYVLRVNNNIPGTNIFRGKAVNLIINCRVSQTTQRLQFDSSCLLFKLEGNTTCPVSNTTITSSSTIHQMQTSSLVPSTPRITASHIFSHASVIQQNVSGAIMSVTPSQTLAIKPTISNLVLNTANSNSIFSRVSTYLGSQPNITEISPILGSATKSGITPVTSMIQLIVSEISPSHPSIFEMSLIAPTTQATVSEVLPVESNTQKTRSGISPTISDALSMASEVLAPVPGTQQTVSNVSPTEPDTTPTDSETSETPLKDPGTSQTPRILLPKTHASNQTALKSNVPPTLSQDRERSIGKESTSVGLIALLPITLIIIAAIVVSLVYRRRYSRKRLRSMSDTISEATMDTLVISPQIQRAIPPDHDRTSCNTLESKYPYSLNASPFEIPEYDTPLSQINLSLEDEDTPCRWYAPANISHCHPGNTEAPFDYVPEKPGTNKNPPIDHTLEDNGQEENNNNNENKEPMYYVLEGPYPEGVDGDAQSSSISSDRLEEEPVYCTVRELFRGSVTKPNSEVSNSSNDDPKCEDEPIYNVLERRYFQGSKVPAHYLPTSPKGQIFGSMKRPSSDSNNQDNVPKDADEPVYDVLDRRYFGGSKVPAHYVHIASNGPMLSSSDVPYFDPSKTGNDGPKCADEPVEKLLEERYLDGSQVPVHYVRVSPNGLVFSTLEKVYLNSHKVPNYDPKCESKPEGGNIMEERYLKGSEIPEHYVQISANRVAFSTLEFRNAQRGSNYDHKCGAEPEVNTRDRPAFNILKKLYRNYGKGSKCGGDEPNDSIVEERYLEGSEVPKHYVKTTPNGPVFSTLEKVHRNPGNESEYDPKCGNESEGSIVEERYLAGSERHENYVEITQNSPVFNILEKLYRNSVKVSKRDPECEHEGVDGGGKIVEERYLKGSEVPSHYVQITAKDPVFNMLENMYRNSLRGSKYHPEREETGSIVEERYLEGSEVPKHYVQITSNGPGFRRYEKLHSSSCKESKSDPKFGNESEEKIVEERYLEGSEVPEHYVQITPNGPVFNILEKLYRDSVKESKHDPDCAKEAVDKNLEERYLEGSEVPKHYVTITPKGLVFCTLERSHHNSQKDSKCASDPKCSNESEGNIVEERYLAGSDVPKHYEPITPKDPVFNVLEKLHRDSVRGSKYDPEHGTDPGDTIVEERYLEGSEVPKHYVTITPKGLVFCTLERSHRNSQKDSKCDPDPKCSNESEGNIVEDRYLAGSELPSHYEPITPKDPVFNVLEKLYRDSIRGSKYDLEHETDPGDTIVEERYVEGSEVPKHYVQITPNGLVFSTLERLHRNSRQGFKCDLENGNESEDNIVEGRYLEGSEVPKQYVEIAPNGPVFNILEKLYRDSVRRTNHDPEHGSGSESNIVEERYLTGSEVPKHYVQITPNGLVFSTLERSHRNSHEGSKCDPQRESELEGSIMEERSLADSEVPKHHVQVTSKDPVLNILKRLYRNSRRKGIKRDPKRRKNPESDSAEEASKETTC